MISLRKLIMGSNKKNIIKVSFYFIILISLSIIFFSFQKYNLSLKTNDSNTNSITELYMKTQYNKQKKELSKIAIKNGCGKQYLGLAYKRYLLDIGYDITESSNADHFGHTSTKIFFHKNNKNSAEYLSKELGINKNQLFQETNLNYFHDLTIILGQDYNNLKSYEIAEEYNPFK